jgi:hypothetical protein
MVVDTTIAATTAMIETTDAVIMAAMKLITAAATVMKATDPEAAVAIAANTSQQLSRAARVSNSMKPVAALLLFAASLPATEIPQGAHLLLRMVNSVNTKTAQEGDFVYLRTSSPVSIDGEIVIPVESYVQGVVSHSKKSGRVVGRAEIAIRIETLTLPSGKVYHMNPHLASVDSDDTGQKVNSAENDIKQGGTKEQDAGRIAILAGSGAAIGGLTARSIKGAGIGAGAGSAVGLATVLLTRGKEVSLKQGATLDVVFDRKVSLE